MSSTTDTKPEAVENVLFDALAAMGPERSAITRTATLEELDLDSLDMVEMAQVVEQAWNIELDPQDFSEVTTVGEALDAVLVRLR
jgi:acyl carrier protein